MATNKPTPIVHIFHEVKAFKTVRHYELQSVVGGKSKLSKLINVAINRGFSKANVRFWVSEHDGKKWITEPRLCGLFSTPDSKVFYSDTEKKKNLLVARFQENGRVLVIEIYPKYYTADLSKII